MQTAPLLLCWSDRAPRASHHSRRPGGDQGPILRLLGEGPAYGEAWVLSTEAGRSEAEELLERMRPRVPRLRLWVTAVEDPSDYEQLFQAMQELLPRVPAGPVDVLLSAGTPQAQATWLILVQAELLRARMLRVIPPDFVPHPHPHAVQEVRLDFAGFPEIRALREEVGQLRRRLRLGEELVGESVAMQALKNRMSRVAAADVPVLILGETGVGKELVARALHRASARREGPWVAESCAAFSEGILTSELFGHEKGAFTGASGRHRGLFERAHGGTLFLDEVGELPLRVQATLLRVLQEGELRRVGGEQPLRVDVRLFVATHRDLRRMVAEGSFREDLYWRLRGAVLELPPLRERLSDLELLVQLFMGSRSLVLRPEVWARLRQWAWPGNVRELKAEVQRWTVFCEREVHLEDLSPELRGVAVAEVGETPELSPLAEVVAGCERRHIQRALDQEKGNLSRAARLLDIDRNTLKRKLRPTTSGGRTPSA
ncbi:MAG TPA: sigma-54 dependent transcriptional regulator, partial [Myxococcota bacterium]|nr:sigma-54 dependent transcriptional regulator [Myxococcota bacterium]